MDGHPAGWRDGSQLGQGKHRRYAKTSSRRIVDLWPEEVGDKRRSSKMYENAGSTSPKLVGEEANGKKKGKSRFDGLSKKTQWTIR